MIRFFDPIGKPLSIQKSKLNLFLTTKYVGPTKYSHLDLFVTMLESSANVIELINSNIWRCQIQGHRE